MLPPPTTMAGCTPRSMTSASSCASNAVDPVEMPYPVSGGENASPESLRRTRWYCGRVECSAACSPSPMRGPSLAEFLAQPVSDESPDGAHLVQELLDRPRVVLHVLLVEQDRLLVEGLHLALDDVRDDLVGLAHLLGLGLEDPALVLEDLGADLVSTDVLGCGRARDVQRDVLHELTESVG